MRALIGFDLVMQIGPSPEMTAYRCRFWSASDIQVGHDKWLRNLLKSFPFRVTPQARAPGGASKSGDTLKAVPEPKKTLTIKSFPR